MNNEAADSTEEIVWRLVRDAIASVMMIDETDIRPSDLLHETLGMDSLDRLSVVLEIEDEAEVFSGQHIVIPQRISDRWRTVKDAIESVCGYCASVEGGH